MVGITTWSPIAASNALVGSIDWREGMKPRDINNSARYLMADVAAWLAAPTFPSGLGVIGALTVSTTVNVGGVATFGSNVIIAGITKFAGDANFNAQIIASNPIIYLDTNSLYGYNRASSFHDFNVNGTSRVQIGTTGIGITGSVVATGGGSFGGVVTVPTAAGGTNTTQIATTAFVRSEIATLIGSAPASLDTLQEFATALGSDPNFATTITNALAGKAALAGAAFTGTISFGDANHNLQITGGNARHTFDTGDYMEYDRTANKLTFYGGGVAMASINFNNGNILTKGTIGAAQTTV